MSVNRGEGHVALVLMKSEEADATLDVLRAEQPDAKIVDQGTYWMVTAPREIVVEMSKVAEELGRPIDLSGWLVVMSSFVGRAETEPDSFRVTSEMLQMSPVAEEA